MPLLLRSIIVAVALCAVGVLLAGCGGDETPTRADFTQAVVTGRDRVDLVISRAARATTADEFLTRLDEAAAVIDDTASELDEVGAADGFETQHAKLVKALHALSADYSSFAHDARQPGGEILLAGGPGLNFESWDDANAALASMKDQGVAVEPIGRH